MVVWDKNIPWGFVFLAAAVVGAGVNYPEPVCAVKGSTVTLLCTFTPVESHPVVRVRWCRNHLICQSTTPSVYDSSSKYNDPRYEYLGDKTGNCTLQISNIQKTDEATLRFRMEAESESGHYTDRSGVNVTVTDKDPMWIKSSATVTRRGQNVTLLCSTNCTFHQMEVAWHKNGRTLSESGPALKLGPLTAEDSGNYTCGLSTIVSSLSPPYKVHVEAEEEGLTASGGSDPSLLIGVVCGGLLALLIVMMVVCIIRRRSAADEHQTSAGGQVPKRPDEETSGGLEDISYASVQFKRQNQISPVVRSEDDIIYSSVANRG